MFSVSLSPHVFWPAKQDACNQKLLQEYGGIEGLLRGLKGLGVTHIELRNINPNDDPQEALICARAVWEAGFTLTVHGAAPSEIGSFAETCPSMMLLLKEAKAYQPYVTITFHSYTTGNDADKTEAAERTNQLLLRWSADAKSLGFRLALELNRDKKNGDPSVTEEGVLAMLRNTDPETVGICFDFGHYYSNTRDDVLVPPKVFLDRVFHTHIHALGSGGTHFPFEEDTALPLDAYVQALTQANYSGVYNLELDFVRYPEKAFRECVRNSVVALKGAVYRADARVDKTRAALGAALDAAYPIALADLAQTFASAKSDRLCAIGPSAQVFCVGGCRFAVDPVIRSQAVHERSVAALRDLLSQVSVVFITHEHGDHFDPVLVRELADLPCLWVFGTSFSEEILAASALPQERIRRVAPGERFSVEGIDVQVFLGQHFQPDGTGVPSVMYLLTVGGKRIFLPADVRDYGVDRFPEIASPDVMIANVWLGRGKALCTDDGAYEEFCDYVAYFRPKRVLLGHLWEHTREATDLWRWEQAGRVMDGLIERLPRSTAQPLQLFCWYEI